MKTVKQLIKEAESHLDDEHKDVNVAKVLFYHLAKKEENIFSYSPFSMLFYHVIN